MGLGEHIRHLRAAYGFDVVDLALRARLSPSRVHEIESGAPTSTAELAELADALAVDPALLHAGRAEEVRRTVARFRAPIGIGDLSGPDARLLARAAEAGRLCAELSGLLGKRSSPVIEQRRPSAVLAYPEPWVQGYELGAAARQRLAPNALPLESVQRTFEEFGVHVAQVSFEAGGIEAASLLERRSAPVILLNKNSIRVTYRLSRRAILAHELCHLLHDGGERDLAIISQEEGLDTGEVEKRANAFAPSFLAPKQWVSVRKSDPMAIVLELAQTWGLSFEGAAWHAKNMGLIEEDRAEYFRRMAGKPYIDESRFESDVERTPPDYVGIEAVPTDMSRGYLSELAVIACAEGLISKGRAAEILALR